MGNKLAFTVAGFTHVGNRDYNEDRYCVLGAPDNTALLIVVADGMGGHEGGELAAQTIIEQAEAEWQSRNPSQEPEAFLEALTVSCHQAVVTAGNAVDQVPRATFAALLIGIDQGEVCATSVHVGDSRIMQFSPDGLTNQSIDHSLAQLKVLQGKIKQEDVATDPDQNKVINNMGGEDDPEPEITHWDIKQGARFVVCSDGFWEMFAPDDMQYLFQSADAVSEDDETLEEIIEQLFLSKLQKLEKQDNTTAVMVSDVTVAEGDTTVAPPTADPVAGPGATMNDPVTARPAASRGKSLGLIGGVLVIALALGYFLFGASDQPDTVVVAVPDTQSPDDSAEPRGESVPQAPTAPANPAPSSESGAVGDGDALATIDQELDIPVTSDEEMLQRVLELLRQDGILGIDDELVISSDGEIDGNRVIRIVQEYRGIPVFGGEIVLIQREGTLTDLLGDAGADIAVDTDPALTFTEAVAIAAANLDTPLTPRGEGRLYIYDAAGTFHLAWIGILSTASAPERFVLDADDGSVLARMSMVLEEGRQQ